MLETGYPAHVVELLVKLYRKQQARVKVAGVIYNWLRVKRCSTRLCSFTLSIQSPIFNILLLLLLFFITPKGSTKITAVRNKNTKS